MYILYVVVVFCFHFFYSVLLLLLLLTLLCYSHARAHTHTNKKCQNQINVILIFVHFQSIDTMPNKLKFPIWDSQIYAECIVYIFRIPWSCSANGSNKGKWFGEYETCHIGCVNEFFFCAVISFFFVCSFVKCMWRITIHRMGEWELPTTGKSGRGWLKWRL